MGNRKTPKYWYAGRCLTTCSHLKKKKSFFKGLIITFANYHGVNSPTTADFRLLLGCH